jgi:nitroreductase
MDEELARQVVELAGRAPSVHNTQPWQWRRHDGGLDLYADRTRQLPALDPTGRQLVVSCGAALGSARLGVRALGWSCTVELLPDPADADHLARLSVGPALPPTEDELALAREIGHRRTVRDRFDPVRLTPAARTALERTAEADGAWLLWLDTTAQQVSLAVLTDRVERIEQADRAFRAEIARWHRSGDTATDGLTPAMLAHLGLASRPADVPLRDFGPAGADPPGADPPEADAQRLPLPVERPDLVVLGTRWDGPTSWLQAGQALATVLLRATELGLASSPVGQALDLPWSRRRLRMELGMTGHPQMVLRLGHGGMPGGRSPRRPVGEILGV